MQNKVLNGEKGELLFIGDLLYIIYFYLLVYIFVLKELLNNWCMQEDVIVLIEMK